MWNKPKIWREIQIKQTNVIISIQRLREISSEQYNGCGKFQAKQCNVCGKYGINFVSKVLVIFPVVGLVLVIGMLGVQLHINHESLPEKRKICPSAKHEDQI